jgi:hypothetical protein
MQHHGRLIRGLENIKDPHKIRFFLLLCIHKPVHSPTSNIGIFQKGGPFMGSRFLNIPKDLSPVAKVKASNTYDSCARTDKKSVPSVSGDSLEP